MTIGEWARSAKARLAKAGCPDVEADADWLLCEALGLPRSTLPRHAPRELPPDAADTLDGRLRRREAREPLQYVLGSAGFMGHTFRCDPRALIPRPETESLCEAAIRFLAARGGEPSVLDLCAGGGAIGLSVKLALPGVRLTMTDIDADALALAGENAALFGVGARLLAGDLFGPVAGERFDAILCNPPYVPSGEIGALQAELRAEPRRALDGGMDGLAFYRRIAEEASAHLSVEGMLFLEVGSDRADDVARIMERVGNAKILPDLGGRPRAVAVAKGRG